MAAVGEASLLVQLLPVPGPRSLPPLLRLCSSAGGRAIGGLTERSSGRLVGRLRDRSAKAAWLLRTHGGGTRIAFNEAYNRCKLQVSCDLAFRLEAICSTSFTMQVHDMHIVPPAARCAWCATSRSALLPQTA